MEEALHDMPLLREFAKRDGVLNRLPDETTLLRFRHLLEKHDLAPDMLRVVNDLLQHKCVSRLRKLLLSAIEPQTTRRLASNVRMRELAFIRRSTSGSSPHRKRDAERGRGPPPASTL